MGEVKEPLFGGRKLNTALKAFHDLPLILIIITL
jgi:hypothetical protein